MSPSNVNDERSRAVLAVAGLVFGVALIGLVKDRMAQGDRYLVGPVRLSIGALPSRLESHRDRLLAGDPLVAGPRSVFDASLPDELRRNLLSRPWIKSVENLRRELPGSFHVDVRLRHPVAVVCVGDERLAVDRDAVVLEADSEFGPPDFPEIYLPGENVKTVPIDGLPFRRASVLEALSVLADLSTERNRGHTALDTLVVTAVVVGREGTARREGSADIDLLLDTGVRVSWGRASLSPLHIFELPPGTKLDHLNRLRRTYPGLLGIERVDLRFKDPLVYVRT